MNYETDIMRRTRNLKNKDFSFASTPLWNIQIAYGNYWVV